LIENYIESYIKLYLERISIILLSIIEQ